MFKLLMYSFTSITRESKLCFDVSLLMFDCKVYDDSTDDEPSESVLFSSEILADCDSASPEAWNK